MQVESLGRYRIDKELGRGAMGRVFLAYDPEIDRRVAIKTIQIFAALPEAERAQARMRFVREARTAGKLLHPGIVTVFDVGESDGIPYLAMEYVEGRTLETFCHEDELLPVPTVVALIAAAAEALGFAHDRGIVHRDIKPANLMRVGANAVKIMDFGLAKSPATSVTHDGALFGTPNYMSPEQVRGEPLDGRSDLFSLAVVLYEMTTGRKPFAGDSVSSVLYRIVHEPPKDDPLQLDRVPAPLAAFLERALAKAPADRFPNGRAFAVALRRAGEAARTQPVGPAAVRSRPAPGQPLPAPPLRPAPQPEAHHRRATWPWVAAGGLVIAALAFAAIVHERWLGVPAVAQLETTVRTEPAGLPVRLNGAPVEGGTVRFPADGPFGVLTAVQACREAKHRIEAADAGREIVLVLDPDRAEVSIDPGVPGATVSLNGGDPKSVPATLEIDLCRDNVVETRADGYRPSSVTVPAKASPLDARTLAAAIKLEAIPTGRLILPRTRVPATFLVDGKEVARADGGVELPAGPHEVRAVNAAHFVEIVAAVEVPVGGAVTPELRIPPLARLIVQTFPPNCRVAIKGSGPAWRPAGETPLQYELAPGRYTLRIESPAGGETREKEIDLRAGPNAPVRVSFGRAPR